MIIPSQLGISIPTQQNNVQQVRIVPRHGHYVVEVVYEKEPTPSSVDPDLIAGIDIGLNNLAALTSNKPGFTPILEMLCYKAELAGITVKLTEERHTSKCSFLDSEPICHHDQYIGKRMKRGLFRASTGRRINADVNGSLNIIRKAIPGSFGQGIEGVAVRPVGLPTY